MIWFIRGIVFFGFKFVFVVLILSLSERGYCGMDFGSIGVIFVLVIVRIYVIFLMD